MLLHVLGCLVRPPEAGHSGPVPENPSATQRLERGPPWGSCAWPSIRLLFLVMRVQAESDGVSLG